MAHLISKAVFKSAGEKNVRSDSEKAHGTALGKQIAELINANLTELGAALVEGNPYKVNEGKANERTVTPYSLQGTIEMPPMSFDDGDGNKSTHKWFLNFSARVPEEKDGTVVPAPTAEPVVLRAMTLAEMRNRNKTA